MLDLTRILNSSGCSFRCGNRRRILSQIQISFPTALPTLESMSNPTLDPISEFSEGINYIRSINTRTDTLSW